MSLGCGKDPMVAENQKQRDEERNQSFISLKGTPSAMCKTYGIPGVPSPDRATPNSYKAVDHILLAWAFEHSS